MDHLKATHKQFTHSIYGWDVEENSSLKPNWFEQNIIDLMDWQINVNGMSASAVARSLNAQGILGKRGGKWHSSGISRVMNNEFHNERTKFPHPANWGSKVWHILP
jgi:hypothetical protein